MAENTNTAETLKNEIDSAIATKAADVAKDSANALEAKATELNTEIDSVKSQNVELQKSIDDLKAKMESSTSFGISKKRNEWEEKFAEAQNTFKKSGKVDMELNTKTFVPGASTNTLVPSAYGTENKIYHLPNYKRQLRDVLSSRTEAGGSIIWNRETAETDNSGSKVISASAAETSKTVTRQESTFKTLMNFYTMPEEYFNDISNFESYISGRLMGDLMDLESRQIIHGDGTGANYNGLNTFGTTLGNDAAFGDWADSIGSATVDANRYDAITAVGSVLEQEDFTASCVVVNPFDYYQLALIKANTGEYVLSQALDASGNTITQLVNGIEVVKSNAQAAGTFTVFDKMAAEYVMREGISLEFDRNGTDFQTNSISVRAIIRGNVADWLPQGVKVGNFATVIGVLQGA